MSARLSIEQLDAARFIARLEDFQRLLAACVAEGASIGFILPLAAAVNRGFWQDGVAPGIARGARLLFAALHEGRVVGSVQLVLDTPANQPHRAEVAKLLVHPEHRRQGIARQLMLRLEDAARAHGRELLTLDTRSDDHAEPLYLSLGYEVAGRIPGYALDARQPERRDSTTLMYKTLPAVAAKLGAPFSLGTPPAMPPRSASELWQLLRAQAEAGCHEAPALADGLVRALLQPDDLASALARRCADALAEDPRQAEQLARRFRALHAELPDLLLAACADLEAVLARDPAYASLLEIFLFSKGFLTLQAHRLGHALWACGERLLALHLQARCNRLLAIDIHPAAQLGRGIMLDHGTGIVIGETAVVEDDVSILQQVTLGGTGKEQGDRHPKVRKGVMIGAGAKILGNLEIGEGAKVGAGSVVLHHVAPHTTVVGIPARPVGRPRDAHPAESMDQSFDD